MDRGELLKKLEIARPGLSNRDFIPVLTNFCFRSNQSVLTYNDLIAIRVPCDAPIDGGLKGTLLLSLLGSVDAKDVTITQDDKKVNIKGGKSNMTLPYLPTDEFLFNFPHYENFDPLPFDKKRKQQLDRCLLTCGVDTSQAQYMGVTIRAHTTFSMYSTNGRSVTAYRDEEDISLDENHPIYDYSLILPLEFCKVITALWDDFGDGKLYFDKDRSYVVASFPNCEVFSKLSSISPPDYDSVLNEHMDKIGEAVEIPEGFANALHRASVITSSEHSRAKLDINGGKAEVTAQSTYGQVEDTLDLPDHPDIAVNFDPGLVRNVLDGMESMYVIDKAVYVTDGKVDHLVANYAD